MPSNLFIALGRNPKNRALAAKLAPKEPRSERARYLRKMRQFWGTFSDAAKASLGYRIDQRQDVAELGQIFNDVFRSARFDVFLQHLSGDLTKKSEKYMRGVVRLPSTIPGKEALSRRFIENNIGLIRNVGEEKIVELQSLVSNSVAAGIRHEDLADQVAHILDVGQSRAELIARDQVLKAAGDYNKIAQTSAGVESYVWVTSRDERVREEHAALDGEEFRWDSPPAVGHPGEDIQCRCTASPVIPFLEGI